MAGFGDPRLTAATSDAIAQTANGEIPKSPTREERTRSFDLQPNHCGQDGVDDPTSCNIGAVRANGTPEQVAGATDYGFNLGMAFQIVDDGRSISLPLQPDRET